MNSVTTAVPHGQGFNFVLLISSGCLSKWYEHLLQLASCASHELLLNNSTSTTDGSTRPWLDTSTLPDTTRHYPTLTYGRHFPERAHHPHPVFQACFQQSPMSGRPTRCLDLIFTLTPRPRGLHMQAGAAKLIKKKSAMKAQDPTLSRLFKVSVHRPRAQDGPPWDFVP